ncbi:MAG TPA: hypothetical protein PLB52_04440 [Candidatus Moranbacteria bacterium]|nr:hypothetical protein [Candidatus Moranbacteria bacterium]
MICQVWYSHSRPAKDEILTNFKNFQADSVEKAKKEALSIIQQSVRRWRKGSATYGCGIFLKEKENESWTQIFFIRFSCSTNRTKLLRARSPKCWRAYGEDVND